MEQTRFDKEVIGGVTGGKVADQNIIQHVGKVILFELNNSSGSYFYPVNPPNICTSDIVIPNDFRATFKPDFTYNYPYVCKPSFYCAWGK